MLTAPDTAAGDRATNVRRSVLALGFFAAGITYLDRICLSAAAPGMMAELGLSDLQMGSVFSVFALSYGLFEIPMGWLGDRFGQRKTLARIVLAWSLFTALTGMVRGFAALLAVRFLFGAAEAGAFPTLARALARWFPTSRRGVTAGVMWMGARLGGALAPTLAAGLIGLVGWRLSFGAFALVGVAWCAVFWWWYRDDPAEHPRVNAAERALIAGDAPAPRPELGGAGRAVRAMLASRSLWALFGVYFGSSYGFYFLVTWLPTYFMREHGQTLARSSLYATAPLAAGAIACVLGGGLSDWLRRRTGSLRWARRSVGMLGYLVSGGGFAAAALCRTPEAIMLSLVVSQAALDLAVPVAWATCHDLSGPYGGTAGGIMNTAASLAGMISAISAAWLSTTFGTFHAVFVVAAAVLTMGGLLWLAIDPERPIVVVAPRR